MAAGGAGTPKTPTFTKDIAPIFQEKCEACHRPDSMAPMSLMTFAEVAAVGAVDQGARRRSPDAAVADRSQRRHPEVQERPVAHRRTGRRRSCAGSTPARRRAIRRTCRPPSSGPTIRAGTSRRTFGQKEPDLIIKSYDFTMPAVSQDAWDKRVTPSGITEPRWVRAIEIRPETLKGRKITHHAIAYLEQTEPGAPSDAGPARAVHGMGGRQAGRDDAPRHRQAAAARLQVPLGHSLLAGR